MPFFRMPDIFYTKPTAPDVLVSYGAKPMHSLSVRLPQGPGPHPLLFTIHGGQWKAAYRAKQLEYLCEDLKQHGVATCNIEFRRLGHVGGGFPGTFEDLQLALSTARRHFAEWNINEQRVSLFGHSSGGHLTFSLNGFRSGIGFTPYAMIGVAAVFDVEKVTGKFREVVDEFFAGAPTLSPVNVTQPPGTRQLVLVGARDKLVDQARDYVEKIPPGSNVTFKVIEKAAHFTVIDPSSQVWPEIRQAILDVAL